jgi:hypothetical protein
MEAWIGLRDFYWDIYLCCRASVPFPLVGLEGPIKIVAFLENFLKSFVLVFF